jgi:MotA/TolQ/ExbB proton channel family
MDPYVLQISAFVDWLATFPIAAQWMSYAAGVRLPVYVIGGMLLALAFSFIVFFLLRGISLRMKLTRVIRALRKLDDMTPDLSKSFAHDKTLAHLWREYEHTLHKTTDINRQTGSHEVVSVRSTVPAEAFFNHQTLVDNRLRTEFFKHVPGICTGLGIIGTFLGILQGLSAFKISGAEAEQVQRSLDDLMHGVFEAFLVSAAAITIAMVITLIEKLLISSLYKTTEVVAHRLDAIFEAGGNAEHIERLVRATEDTASQSKILKDALVADLKEVLSELTRQQIEATNISSAQLGREIAASIREPLAQIGNAVQQVSSDQGHAVTTLLTDVLAGFSQRVQDLFGGQIAGINQVQQQAIESLQSVVAKLDQVASGLDTSGQKATEVMAARIGEMVAATETHLKATNDRMLAFVEQVSGASTNTVDKMNDGALTLRAAAGEFAKAAQEVSSLTSSATVASGALTQSSASMTAATDALQGIVNDYRTSRDVLGRMLTELQGAVENAKREASLTSDILERIEGAAGKLAQAQIQAEEYLDKIGEVLAEAHQEFSENMRRTLGEANREFYDQLSQATKLLRAGIQELEVSLSASAVGGNG